MIFDFDLNLFQNAISSGQQQYILADNSGNFKATTFDGGSQQLTVNSQQLIAAAYPQGSSNSLGTEVEMVHYVDSQGHELSQVTRLWLTC